LQQIRVNVKKVFFPSIADYRA